MEEQLPSFGQRGDHDLEPSKVLRNESLVSSKLNAPNYYKSPEHSNQPEFPLNSSKIPLHNLETEDSGLN